MSGPERLQSGRTVGNPGWQFPEWFAKVGVPELISGRYIKVKHFVGFTACSRAVTAVRKQAEFCNMVPKN